MITLVTGTLGSGKSFYGVRKTAMRLAQGKCVASNIKLKDDFAERIARKRWRGRIFDGGVASLEKRISDSYFYSEDLDELMRVKLTGTKEGRGYMPLDEGHGWLNSRAWSAGDRADIVRFFTQARKLGWHLDLITQDDGNIDKQVRVLFEYKVRLRNLKKLKYAGIPIFPFNYFMAITSWNGAKGAVVEREFYTLNWTAHLYDTHAIHHGLAEELAEPSVVLPRVTPRAESSGPPEGYDTPAYRRHLEEFQSASPSVTSTSKPLDDSVSS